MCRPRHIPLWSGWNEEIETTGVWQFNNDAFTAGAFGHTYYRTSPGRAVSSSAAVLADPFGCVPIIGNPTKCAADSKRVLHGGRRGGRVPASTSIVGQADTIGRTGRISGRSPSRAATISNRIQADRPWSPGTASASGRVLLYGALEHRWQGTPFSTFVTADWRPAGGGGDESVGPSCSASATSSISRAARCRANDFEVPFSQGHDTVF